MATEILPAGDGLEETVITTTTPSLGAITTREFSGPIASLEALQTTYLADAPAITNTELRVSRGRGTLRVNFNRIWEELDPVDQAVQELASFDVIRPIYSSPYFRTLDNKLLASVRDVFEQQLRPSEITAAATAYDADSGADDLWGAEGAGGKAWQLLGHLRLGQDSYVETAYEFSKTWRTSSSNTLSIASSDVNTVQALPALSGVMSRLIDSLPAGEWLKKPTTVQSVGGGHFAVRVGYMWAPKWSVVYGGTETGLG